MQMLGQPPYLYSTGLGWGPWQGYQAPSEPITAQPKAPNKDAAKKP